jgi:hypothetical protein
MAFPRWGWFVIGGAAVVILALLGIVAAGVFLAVRSVETARVPAAEAMREFEEVRERFAGQEPLLTLDEAGRPEPMRREPPAQPAPIETVSVLAWDEREARLVRMNLPFWLVRLGNRGKINFRSGDLPFSSEQLDLEVADLERFGPGLVLDFTGRRGERVLVWTQ